jgi:hypothetical protein
MEKTVCSSEHSGTATRSNLTEDMPPLEKMEPLSLETGVAKPTQKGLAMSVQMTPFCGEADHWVDECLGWTAWIGLIISLRNISSVGLFDQLSGGKMDGSANGTEEVLYSMDFGSCILRRDRPIPLVQN